MVRRLEHKSQTGKQQALKLAGGLAQAPFSSVEDLALRSASLIAFDAASPHDAALKGDISSLAALAAQTAQKAPVAALKVAGQAPPEHCAAITPFAAKQTKKTPT